MAEGTSDELAGELSHKGTQLLETEEKLKLAEDVLARTKRQTQLTTQTAFEERNRTVSQLREQIENKQKIIDDLLEKLQLKETEV